MSWREWRTCARVKLSVGVYRPIRPTFSLRNLAYDAAALYKLATHHDLLSVPGREPEKLFFLKLAQVSASRLVRNEQLDGEVAPAIYRGADGEGSFPLRLSREHFYRVVTANTGRIYNKPYVVVRTNASCNRMNFQVPRNYLILGRSQDTHIRALRQDERFCRYVRRRWKIVDMILSDLHCLLVVRAIHIVLNHPNPGYVVLMVMSTRRRSKAPD
jgi:hypothetical protein